MIINFNVPRIELPKAPRDLGRFYWFFVGVRIFCTCLPQTGYIHPDEYFQSTEIIAGDMFRLETTRPKEFNLTFPMQNIVVPYLIAGTGFKFLKILDNIFMEHLNISLIRPYFMIVFPRLTICMLSFLVDYSLYKICRISKVAYKERMVVCASSHVLLVFATHTFLNNVELILVSLLLMYVTESITFSDYIIHENEYLLKLYYKAETPVERARLHKARLFLPDHSLRSIVPISMITVFGTFNRPTFVIFAFLPIFFWLHRGLGNKFVPFREFHYRMFMFVLCCTPTILLLIVIDSFYYGYVSMPEIEHLEITINNFVVTPLNFLKYYASSENLKQKGTYPLLYPVIVNVPVLFNVLGLIAIYNSILLVARFLLSQYKYLPSIRSTEGLMTASILAPVTIFSYFPNQDPRYIVPVALPLIYLHGQNLYPKANCLNLLFKIWLAFNAFFLLFYGFLHQGAVYSATSYLSNELRTKPKLQDYHIVTCGIYRLPESLLLQKSSRIVYSYNNFKYRRSKQAVLYEFGVKSLNFVIDQIVKLPNTIYSNNNFTNKTFRIFLIMPTSMKEELETISLQTNATFNKLSSFYPQISSESFPNLFEYCLDLYPFHNCENNQTYNFINYAIASIQLFGLAVYEYKFV